MMDVESAKQFLLSKVIEEAQRSGIRLSEIEKRIFLFSETSGSMPDMETSRKFDDQYDSEEYESKVANLLRSAFNRDEATEHGRLAWQESLAVLRDEDFYCLVMVDQAGIARPKPTSAFAGVDSNVPFFDIRLVLLIVIDAVYLGVAVLIVFQPARLRLALPDWLRILLFFIFAGLFWLFNGWFELNSRRNPR